MTSTTMAENDKQTVHHSPARRKRLSWMLLALIGLAVAGCFLLWQWRFETYHLAEVQAGVLYRDGHRTPREFATALRRAGIKTVVMLNDDQELQKEPFRSEAELCRQRGVDLIRLPVKLGGRPTTEDVRRFLEIAADPSKQPVLVHCAQGVRRTAMMTAAYQESVLGYSNEKAKDAILPWGRKSHRLDDIRGFIDDYDPVTREVGSKHIIFQEQDSD